VDVAVGAAIDEAMNDEDGSPFNEIGGEDAIKACPSSTILHRTFDSYSFDREAADCAGIFRDL
jgi:hypothetical protein